ncbi:PCRF domain-containing protein, partial [Ignavibacterium album]|uniref:PCRF domain-containing protein n=1 Tax=Ignavibacterium album TaxID=591197 RepID=UPI0038B290A3
MITCGVIFDIDGKEKRITELQKKSESSDFWNDQKSAQQTLQEIKTLQSWVDLWKSVNNKASAVEETI